MDGVSFGVETGEIFVLLGEAGAGKTSVLKMISGLENLSGGTGFLKELSLESFFDQPEKLFGLVGYCPQKYFVEPFMTVEA